MIWHMCVYSEDGSASGGVWELKWDNMAAMMVPSDLLRRGDLFQIFLMIIG